MLLSARASTLRNFTDGYWCRNAGSARTALRRVFDVAPDCGEAKLIEAGLMLEEADFGGLPLLLD